MFLKNFTTRFASLLTLAAMAAGTASAARVNFGDREICTIYEECVEVCEEPDAYGNVYCAFACDQVVYCFGGGPEELPGSEETCDFDDPDFFGCFLE